MTIAHATLGASNAHRWAVCGGSVKAEQGLGDKTSSFAQEGTAAHELSEICLKSGDDPVDWIGRNLVDMPDWKVDSDMAHYVSVYVDYVRNAAKGADDTQYEQRVDYSDWVPKGFGTADAVILKGDTIQVCDLKFGRGVQVNAENNPQGMLYALGAYAENSFIADFKRVVICIIQPRLDHISEWEISVKDLLKWAEWISHRAEIALSDDAERVAGESQCRFCKAKATCKTLYNYTESVILSEFDDLDAQSPDTLTDKQVRKVLESKSLIEGWLTSVEGYVRERLDAGEDFEGFKLVEGRSIRCWVDEDKAAEALTDTLGDNLYTKKLVSPAQAEKLLKKDQRHVMSDLVVKPKGKPTLAPESDKRPAVNATNDDFEDIS
jgi:hypothetical protein